MRNFFTMLVCFLYFTLFFPFITMGNINEDSRKCITGKNLIIEVDPRHSDWCFNSVNKDNELKKGIKVFPYSDYIKDYSKEALEKLFPVDPQWEEWYRLDKEGKLPKNIRITDRDCWFIMNTLDYNVFLKCSFFPVNPLLTLHLLNFDTNCLQNRNLDNMVNLINYKNQFIKGSQYDIAYYRKELAKLAKEPGRLWQWWENSYVNHNLCYFPLYLDTIKQWDQLKNWKQNFYYNAYNGMIFTLLALYRHPNYFAPEMNYLKEKYIPVLWELYNNPSHVTKNPQDQLENKYQLLSLLYLLGEDFNILVVEHERMMDKNNSGFVFQDTIEYWDIANAKVIEVTDLKFKPYIEKRLHSKSNRSVRNALLYFYDIGAMSDHLDSAILYCYKNIKSNNMFNGFDILKLLICWRNDERVEKLAYYYLNHINEFTYDLDREIKKKFLIEEFGLQENKASEITKKQ